MGSRGEVENQVLKNRKEVEDWARAPAGIELLTNQRGYAGGPTIPPPVRWSTRRYCYGHTGSRVFYAETQPSNSSPICLPIDRVVAASPESRAARRPRRRSLNFASRLKMASTKGLWLGP